MFDDNFSLRFIYSVNFVFVNIQQYKKVATERPPDEERFIC